MLDKIKNSLIRLKVRYILNSTVKAVLRQYNDLDQFPEEERVELKKAVEFIKQNGTGAIPYPADFPGKHGNNQIEAGTDNDGLNYIVRNGRRLYGKRSWSKEKFREYYAGLMIEQDKGSPHCYITDNARLPKNGGVLADIGTAEGIFAFDMIDLFDKLYLFECDPEWIEPLNRTFEEYRDKIEIVESYVGDKDSPADRMITLDSFFKDKDLTYVKADIEGAEEKLLIGAENTLKTRVEQILLCAYHHPQDKEIITGYLSKYGFTYDINKGYMIYSHIDRCYKTPMLRRGIIYGYKNT